VGILDYIEVKIKSQLMPDGPDLSYICSNFGELSKPRENCAEALPIYADRYFAI